MIELGKNLKYEKFVLTDFNQRGATHCSTLALTLGTAELK